MVLWKQLLDKYISVIPQLTSSSFLLLIFSFPGLTTSIHISIYLPTSGKDIEFVEQIVKLNECIRKLSDKHPEAVIYIRGDANVNHKDVNRKALFKKVCHDWNLVETVIKHPTYHHFQGEGMSDSQLDVLLHSKNYSETLNAIICKLSNHLVSSHHDVLLSTFSVPPAHSPTPEDNPLAPRVDNRRVKIHWTETGIEHFKTSVDQNLTRMRSNWLDPSSPALMSVLLQSTNDFLDKCARNT